MREHKFEVVLVAVFIVIIVFFGWLLLSLNAKLEDCESRGGIPVKSQNGPVYCFSHEALQP